MAVQAILVAALRARDVACTETGREALRAAVRAGCSTEGGLFRRSLRRGVAGGLSGGLIPLICMAGGPPALEEAFSAACAAAPPTAPAAPTAGIDFGGVSLGFHRGRRQ